MRTIVLRSHNLSYLTSTVPPKAPHPRWPMRSIVEVIEATSFVKASLIHQITDKKTISTLTNQQVNLFAVGLSNLFP